MGKKIKAEMDAQRERFVTGAVGRGIAKANADTIFDACAKFAEYGFNKSHSAPYAFIAYQTAWFKANHPAEFLAASMTLDKSNTDKLAEFRAEALRLGLKVAPPSVNGSDVDFDVRQDGSGALSIAYALSAIKGVGEGQAGGDRRRARGTALRLSRRRRAARRSARRQQEDAGEVWPPPAPSMNWSPIAPSPSPRSSRCWRSPIATPRREAAGQNALFGEVDSTPLKVRADPWPTADRLRREFDAVGFFLSGHPLEAYDSALKRLRATRWADFSRAVRGGASTARLGASVLDRYERRTKSGSKLGVIQLSDPSGQYEAIIFQEGLSQYRDLLEKGSDVLVTLQANVDGEDVRARIVQVELLTLAAAKVHKGLRVFVRDEAPLASIEERLRARGEGEVWLVVMLGPREGEVEVKLPGRYAVTGALAGALKAVAGVVAVEHV